MQQILTERHSGKTKQKTNWSVSTFKGKLKFFRFKIVKYKTRAFNNREFEIKPCQFLFYLCISQIEASTSPRRAYPGHLMPFPAREGGNLITSLDIMLRVMLIPRG